MLRIVWMVMGCLLWAVETWGATPASSMFQADYQGRRIEGLPLSASRDRLYLLGRDGKLWDLPTGQLANVKPTQSSFRSLSQAEIQALLQLELGMELEVTGTGHFLVAHPKGEGAEWAGRFEEVYRSFTQYFQVRGFQLREPGYPLIAIVFKHQDRFARYAQQDGTAAPPGLMGYYSLKSNRIALFDSSGKNNKDWQRSAGTIIHEVTHQCAFNLGVHNRFSPPPRWLAEGLGMLYEAKGFYDSTHHSLASERINRERLADYRNGQKLRAKDALLTMIGDDRGFNQDPIMSYALAWSFSFFLAEKHPREYHALLTKTAANANFAPYPAAQRMTDFTQIMGNNWPQLEAEFQRFIAELK